MYEWKQIVGYEGIYEVSSKGEIRSVDRYDYFNNQYGECKRFRKGIIMKPQIDRYGYLYIGLRISGQKQIKHKIHRLVGKAFIPNIKHLPTIDHIDNNKLNNEVSNLQWMTFEDNNKKRFK